MTVRAKFKVFNVERSKGAKPGEEWAKVEMQAAYNDGDPATLAGRNIRHLRRAACISPTRPPSTHSSQASSTLWTSRQPTNSPIGQRDPRDRQQ